MKRLKNDNDLFNFSLHYNDATAVDKRLYNGNISETLWHTANVDSGIKQYTYSYDALNRITQARFNTTSVRYWLRNVSYDKNGNIVSLLRNG